jgi:hypothetical protein
MIGYSRVQIFILVAKLLNPRVKRKIFKDSE